MDIYLPICGEPAAVLRNTWTAVAALTAAYQGVAQVYVLDDGPADEVAGTAAAADSFGFRYLRRPDTPTFKKSGNLRHAFARTDGEFLVILDADFAPRPDFLAETLPYMDNQATGIVQTPQFFRASPRQTWIENAAGSIQEVFYRSIQVARDRFDAAACVGTSALYRRAALEPRGRPDPDPVRRGRAHRPRRPPARLVPGLRARDPVDRHLPGQLRLLRAPAVPVVLRERRDRLLPPAVVDPDDHARPADLYIRVRLLRLHRPC